jgi:hypothetical protein
MSVSLGNERKSGHNDGAMKASRWSLGETILVVIVVWLATINLGALAWNHHWRLPFGVEVPELVLLLVIAMWFFRPKRGNREDR